MKDKAPISTTNVSPSQLRHSKVKPELQFHCAATLIVHGDPFGLTSEDRNDKAGEIAQFCVPVPAKFVGNLKQIHVHMAFKAMYETMLKRLREHGVMAQGE